MSRSEDFRMPASFVRRKFLPFLSLLPASVLFMPVVGLPWSFANVLGNVGFASLMLGLGYYLAISSVAVSVTHEGLGGRGPSGRKIALSWSEGIYFQPHTQGSVEGLPFGRSTRLNQLFVPAPILNLPTFRAAVLRHSPASHPLRGEVQHGT